MTLTTFTSSALQHPHDRTWLLLLMMLFFMPLSVETSANNAASVDNSHSNSQPQSDQDTQITFWTSSMTEARKAHETAVVRLALEKSRDRYGPYQLNINKTLYSPLRAMRNLRDGTAAQVITSPMLAEPENIDDKTLITVPRPLLQGLLGQRMLIIKRDRAQDFAEVRTLNQLQNFSAGLGGDWLDRGYYNHAKLPFTRGNDIDQLFNMLTHGRFDYLPLSSVEAIPTLAASEHAAQLMIVEHLVVHYPLYVYIQVSLNRPDIATRLKLGLDRAEQDGSLEALFKQHYGGYLTTIKNAHTIKLQHHLPEISNEQ